jgi:hypothetical protein
MKATLCLGTTMILATGLFAATAEADHPRRPGINRRQASQRQDVRQGVRSGEITRR